MTPVTAVGRLMTIVYAAIGIPLALLLLAELGKLFTRGLKYAWALVRRSYYHGCCRKVKVMITNKLKRNSYEPKPAESISDDAELGKGESEEEINGSRSLHEIEALSASDAETRKDQSPISERRETRRDKSPSTEGHGSQRDKTPSTEGLAESRSRSGSKIVYGVEVDDEFNLPISIAIGILFLYIFMGATMYMFWEDWTFIESFYFVFVSLSTIGYGDVLPAHQKFFIISSVYMFIGLSLVSMCINVAIEFFNTVSQRAKRKMGEAKRKLGDKVNQASRNAREKVSDIKGNLRDETTKLRQKTDEKFSNVKKNISEETSKLKQKTDKTFSDLKTNISTETARFKKRADEKFRKRSQTPDNGSPFKGSPDRAADSSRDRDAPQDDTYETIDDVTSNRSSRPGKSSPSRAENKTPTRSPSRSPATSPTKPSFTSLGALRVSIRK